MAEWLVEAGIGEDRAALVESAAIVEARIERHGALRVGDRRTARLLRKAGRAGRSEAVLDAGGVVLLDHPPGLTEGARLTVEIVREAIPEPGNPKLPVARATERPPGLAPSLAERLSAGGAPAREVRAHGPDLLEAAGWSELLDQAETGLVPFVGGLLRIALTPAMTVIDVDGDLPPAELALRGAAASARAIRRLGIAGSIGIDLPTLPDKRARQAAAEAVDAVLPQPFERTAVNGFGFLQIVRRRERASLMEQVQADPIGAETLALLRRLEREPPGEVRLDAPVRVQERLSARPDWLKELARRRGRAVPLPMGEVVGGAVPS